MINTIKKIVSKKNNKKDNSENDERLKKFVLSGDINDNVSRLKEIMNNSFDIKDRELNIGGSNVRAAIVYIDSLSNEDIIMDHIIKPLIISSPATTGKELDIQYIKDFILTSEIVKEVEAFDEIVFSIMSGDSFICIQGHTKGLIINTKEYKGRISATPTMEPSVKGPQEAFVEMLKINMALIRRRIRDPNLTLDMSHIGRRTKTEIVIAYIKGIANDDIVDEVKRRISSIDIDSPTSVSQIGKLIVEKPNSIFPLAQLTERPDKLVSSLTEGRIAVIMNGSPDALIVPVTLPILMQSADDYFESWIMASIIRIARYVSLFASSLLPAIYIAVTAFNPGMLPTNLALSIAATRVGVPFPAIIEALLMVTTLELLQEASIRLPKIVGQTVSIVGGLVIGQAAVQAGVVSPIMVIIISVTAVSSFTIPNYSLGLATRVIRIPFMLLAVTFGNFGIIMGMLLLLTYLASLKSFGIRYLAPLSPYRLRDWKDAIIRAPLWTMEKRPEFLKPEDTRKQIIKKRRESNES